MAKDGIEAAEKTPSNVATLKDNHLPHAEYRIIYSPHAGRTAITREELGAKEKMRAFCIELTRGTKFPLMHVDSLQAMEAFKGLEPRPGERGYGWIEDALHVGRVAKSRFFYTDIYLPTEFVMKEFHDADERSGADLKAVMIAATASAVAAAMSGKLEKWINDFFKKTVVSKRQLLGGIVATGGAAIASFLPLPVQDFLLPEGEHSAVKLSERPLSRITYRTARRAEEVTSIFNDPTMLGVGILRNFCIAFKTRAAVRLMSETAAASLPIRAVLPLGDAHFGIEEAFKLSDVQLIETIKKLATRLKLNKTSMDSIFSLAEIKTPGPGIATATIHPLRNPLDSK